MYVTAYVRSDKQKMHARGNQDTAARSSYGGASCIVQFWVRCCVWPVQHVLRPFGYERAETTFVSLHRNLLFYLVFR